MMKYRRLGALMLSLLLIWTCTACHHDGSIRAQEEDSAAVTIRLPEDAGAYVSIAIGSDGSVYTAARDGIVSRCSMEGELLQSYPGTENVCALEYADGRLYGFNAVTRDIVRIDPEDGTLQVLYAGLDAAELRAMAVVGDVIYLIAAPVVVSLSEGAAQDGYLDCRERLYALDCTDGVLAEITEIEHPITLYYSSEGELYIYAHPGEHYVLYRYDPETDSAVETAKMDGAGYLRAFTLERDYFIYSDREGGVSVQNMADGLSYTVSNARPVVYQGGCFSYYQKKLIYLTEDGRASADPLVPRQGGVETLELGDAYVTSENEEPVEERGSVVIATASGRYFDDRWIYAKSGIRASFQSYNAYLAEQAGSILSYMEAHPEEDIYILPFNSYEEALLRQQGAYVPLNGTAGIEAYFDNAFNWVRESATAENGDIWALPIRYFMRATFYVPEKFDKYGLTTEDFGTFDQYWDTLTRLKENVVRDWFFDRFFGATDHVWEMQYENAFCDYPAGEVCFETELFRSYAERAWLPWSMVTGDHKLLSGDASRVHRKNRIRDSVMLTETQYDAERVVFTNDYVDEFLGGAGVDLGKWRVLPLPHLIEGDTGNVATGTFAVVNPFSENREMAIEYLEAAASDMLSSVRLPCFTLQDPAAYEGHFDMTLPIYQDLYALFRDAYCPALTFAFYSDDWMDMIRAVRNGELTPDEGIHEIQSRVETLMEELTH